MDYNSLSADHKAKLKEAVDVPIAETVNVPRSDVRFKLSTVQQVRQLERRLLLQIPLQNKWAERQRTLQKRLEVPPQTLLKQQGTPMVRRP